MEYSPYKRSSFVRGIFTQIVSQRNRPRRVPPMRRAVLMVMTRTSHARTAYPLHPVETSGGEKEHDMEAGK